MTPPVSALSKMVGQDPSLPVLSTGHADLVDTPEGDWYAVFLATRPQSPQNVSGAAQLGRETFLAPVIWSDDGWPVINSGEPVTLNISDSKLYYLPRQQEWIDNFDQQELVDNAYYTARTPYRSFHTLAERPGYLRLRGNPYTLSDRETPAAFFRKQVDLNVVWSTELEFEPQNDRHEAGLSVYLSIHYHNEIAITSRNGTKAIVTQTRTGPEATFVEEVFPFDSGNATSSVILAIKASASGYELGYSFSGEEDIEYVTAVGNVWLQTHLEGWQTFTGTFFGLYATGNGFPILVPAVNYS